MGFPGTWMTETESMVYRVVPKCACSTIGQIMFFSDHGSFYDGDIHDAKSGLHKWALDESQGPITRNVTEHSSYAFTCVRNPYSRVLSSSSFWNEPSTIPKSTASCPETGVAVNSIRRAIECPSRRCTKGAI